MLLLPSRLDQDWLRPRPRWLPSEAGAAPGDAVPHSAGKTLVADGVSCGGNGNGASGDKNLFYVLIPTGKDFEWRVYTALKFSSYDIRATSAENSITDYIIKQYTSIGSMSSSLCSPGSGWPSWVWAPSVQQWCPRPTPPSSPPRPCLPGTSTSTSSSSRLVDWPASWLVVQVL